MINEITQHAYRQTMASGMTGVAENIKTIFGIWPYVNKLVKQQIVLPYVFKK
jgi:hypothetical protein